MKVALSGEGGDELFGGYYTYAADLLAERAGWPAPILRPVVERLPLVEREGELRLQGEAVRPGGASPSARAAPRLEGDLLAGRARRADRAAQRLRPGRSPPRAVRGDRGRRPARTAPGRRPRDVPRRRPAREDRPGVDGALARGARAVPRPGRDEFLARAAEAAQGARPREEGPAAEGRGAAAFPRRSCGGASAGFSIPAAAWLRGELEPFARETLSAESAAAPGILRARGGDEADRRPRRGPRGPEPPALGPARVHALARASRGARTRPAPRAKVEALGR